jgi:hypothetical protein
MSNRRKLPRKAEARGIYYELEIVVDNYTMIAEMSRSLPGGIAEDMN